MIEKILKIGRITIEAILFLSIFFCIYNQKWELLFFVIIALVAIFLSRFFFSRYKIKLPIEFELLITCFVTSSIVLGEAIGYYGRFEWWDTMLHTLAGFVLGFAGFLVLFVLYKTEKLKASPFFIAFFCFCFGVTFGVIWEIFEFWMDETFGVHMQVNSLHDTMVDLIVDSLGSLGASTWGYFYIKYGRFRFDTLVNRFKDKNPQLFEIKEK